MSVLKDPFEVLVVDEESSDFSALSSKPVVTAHPAATAVPCAATARLHGFNLEDQPLIAGVPGLPGEIVPAQTSVLLLRAQIGSRVVLLFDEGDVRRPIIVGVLQPRRSDADVVSAPPQLVSAQVDDDRLVLLAEREIVLRCGDASISLTRAGKIIIKGSYILSRSSGHNRIKGAAVDIN